MSVNDDATESRRLKESDSNNCRFMVATDVGDDVVATACAHANASASGSADTCARPISRGLDTGDGSRGEKQIRCGR
jgi:hypothetical protein